MTTSNNGNKLPYPQRRAMIVSAAMRVAEARRLSGMSHDLVAEECSATTSTATVRRFFPRMVDLFDVVINDPRCTDETAEQARDMGMVK